MIIIGIPAFNEQGRIGKVVNEAKKYCDQVIVCDDGSSDLTIDEAEGAGAIVIRKRHGGYGDTLSSLFVKAKSMDADIFVTLDGDGQHDPHDIPAICSLISSGDADIVIGSRFLNPRGEESRYRKAAIQAIGALSSSNVTDSQSGFRAYNKKAIRVVTPTEMGMGASTEILSRASDGNLKIKEVPITVNYPKESHSHNPIYHMLDVIFSTIKQASIRHPLIFYGLPGTGFLFLSACLLLWLLNEWTIKGYIVTNIAIATFATGFIGAIFCTISILLWVLISVIRERRD